MVQQAYNWYKNPTVVAYQHLRTATICVVPDARYA